jgi:hypothetical protein
MGPNGVNNWPNEVKGADHVGVLVLAHQTSQPEISQIVR